MKASMQTMVRFSMTAMVLLAGHFLVAGGQSLNLAVSSTGEVMSGGPSAEEGERALRTRIEQQGEGKITLVNFISTKTNLPPLELDGRTFCQLEFNADLEFAEPCRWALRFGGRPLAFKCLKPGERNRLVSEMPGQTVEVTAKGQRYTIYGSVWFRPGTNGWTLAGFGSAGEPTKTTGTTNASSRQCLSNLKLISVAFRTWALDHDDHYPFNVSTNGGGSREFCQMGKEGFDQNAAFHLRLLADVLGTPQALVCPGDSAKLPASTFQSLQGANISYQLRTGAAVDEANGEEILACCPIHGFVLKADGGIK